MIQAGKNWRLARDLPFRAEGANAKEKLSRHPTQTREKKGLKWGILSISLNACTATLQSPPRDDYSALCSGCGVVVTLGLMMSPSRSGRLVSRTR